MASLLATSSLVDDASAPKYKLHRRQTVSFPFSSFLFSSFHCCCFLYSCRKCSALGRLCVFASPPLESALYRDAIHASVWLGLWSVSDNYFSFKCTLFGRNMFFCFFFLLKKKRILHLTATAARTSAEYWHECGGMMCLPGMPFENIGSVSTVESNYFFAKPN